MGPDRLPPLPEGSLTPAQRRAAAELATGPRGAVFGPFVPLLRSPDFLSPLQKAGEYLRYKSALPAAALGVRDPDRRAPLEPAVRMAHPPADRRARRRPGRRTSAPWPRGGARTTWRPTRPSVHDFLQELQDNRAVSDTTYGRAVELFGERGVVDLCGLCGYYSLLAMVMNVARTPLPDGVAAPLEP